MNLILDSRHKKAAAPVLAAAHQTKQLIDTQAMGLAFFFMFLKHIANVWLCSRMQVRIKNNFDQ